MTTRSSLWPTNRVIASRPGSSTLLALLSTPTPIPQADAISVQLGPACRARRQDCVLGEGSEISGNLRILLDDGRGSPGSHQGAGFEAVCLPIPIALGLRARFRPSRPLMQAYLSEPAPSVHPTPSVHIEGHVGQGDRGLARAMPMVRMNRPMRSFCSTKTCSIRARIFDFAALVRATACRIGLPLRLLAMDAVNLARLLQYASLDTERWAGLAHTSEAVLAGSTKPSRNRAASWAAVSRVLCRRMMPCLRLIEMWLLAKGRNGQITLRRFVLLLPLCLGELHRPARIAILLSQLGRLALPFFGNLACLDGGLLGLRIALLRCRRKDCIDDLPAHRQIVGRLNGMIEVSNSLSSALVAISASRKFHSVLASGNASPGPSPQKRIQLNWSRTNIRSGEATAYAWPAEQHPELQNRVEARAAALQGNAATKHLAQIRPGTSRSPPSRSASQADRPPPKAPSDAPRHPRNR